MKTRLLIFFTLIFALGCKEEILLDSVQNKKALVVDGFITNEPGPYRIRLTYTSNANQPEILPVTGCEVIIDDNTGNTEILIEKEPGNYYTSESGIIGIIGNQYKLSIKTPEGKEYTSEFQEMKAAVGIDSIYAKTEFIPNIDFPYGIPGYMFYLDTKPTNEQQNYFLWGMTETYKYDIDYELGYIIDKYGDQITNTLAFDTIETCWKTESVKYISTGTTANLTNNQLFNKQLYFVSTETKKLTKRYSVLVKQYTIDKQAFQYWDEVRKQITNENILTTSQPYNVNSNIFNTSDNEEKILGYFTVASVVEKRIFVDQLREPFYFNKTVVITDQRTISDYKRVHKPPYYYVKIENESYGLLADPACLDCRNEGGTLNKPDFWID
mgnify:CR=1 FL=1